MEKGRPDVIRDASFQSFTSSSTLFALKESRIGPSVSTSSQQHTSLLPLELSPPETVMLSSRTSQRSGSVSSLASTDGAPELTRIPSSSLVITKEKGSSTTGSARTSRRTSARTSRQTSRQSSAHNSGSTTPVNRQPARPISEAALRLSASLRSYNDRLSESPDKGLGSVFNADYNNVSKSSSLLSYENQDPVMEQMTFHRDDIQEATVTKDETLTPRAVSPASPVDSTDAPTFINTSHDINKVSRHSDYKAPPIMWSAQSRREQLPITLSVGDDHSSELLKLNAQLEGKLEMLSVEAEIAIKERAQYQAELGALKSKLQLHEQQGLVTAGYVPEADYNHIQKLMNDLQRRCNELQKLIEQKSAECLRISEALTNTKELNSKLQSTVTNFGQQIKEKDNEVIELKAKIQGLDKQLTNISGDSLSSADTISGLQDDIMSLTQTKDWYQQQLHNAQETRNSLQTELTRLQNLVSSQTDNLERVMVENTQIKHQLADTQHKALAEKQMLIRHLEAIEADMLEREAGFEQLEREKGVNESSWQQKMMQVEKERLSLSKMMTESSDLERQLQKANHDLSARIAEVTVLEAQQEELNNRLLEAQASLQQKDSELEGLRERLVEAESTLNKVQKQERERGQLLQSLKQEKASLQVALNSAVEEKKSFAKAVDTLKSNTAKVEQNYKSMKQELASKNQLISGYEADKAQFVEQLELVQQETISKYGSVPVAEVSQLKGENGTLREHMGHLKSDLEDTHDKIECLTVEKKTLEQQLAKMKTNAVELEHMMQKSHSEKTTLDEKLHLAIAKLDQHNQLRESDEIMEQKLTNQQNKIESLQAELAKASVAQKERAAEHEKSIQLLSNQLQDAISERDTAYKNLRQHEETSQENASSQQEHLYAQIQMLRSQLEASQLQKGDLETQIARYHTGVQEAVKDYQKRIVDYAAAVEQYQTQLLQERAECEASIARHKAECETNKMLNMELERGKGRLAAMQEQHAKLKQHAADMESALAQRESSIVQLNAASLAAERKHDQMNEEQRMKIRQLEEDMNNQSTAYDQLHKQMGSSKSETEQTQELVDRLKLDNECIQQEVDKKSLALASAQTELKTAQELSEKQNTNIAMLNKEYRSAKLELEQLRRHVSENAARNPIISDEMQALKWQVKQKSKETSDAQNQLQLCEQRMEIETDNIKKALTEANKELESIKLELQGVRSAKFAYQNRIVMLRSGIKKLLTESQAIIAALTQSGGQAPQKLEIDKYVDLLRDTAAPGYKSKPLENLKSCLSSLHSEMSSLQQQMDDHKTALATNSDSWRAVGNEMAELQRMMNKSSNKPAEVTTSTAATNGTHEHSTANNGNDSVFGNII